MLSWVNDVERTNHAAARLEYHHSSDVQTIIARARNLQDIRERWAVPTSDVHGWNRFRGSRKEFYLSVKIALRVVSASAVSAQLGVSSRGEAVSVSKAAIHEDEQ